jgi:hypothetical protein
MPEIKWTANPKNLVEVTAKHLHPSPACTDGKHNSDCAGYGREVKCTDLGFIVIERVKYPLGCLCEHHVGPELPLQEIIQKKIH